MNCNYENIKNCYQVEFQTMLGDNRNNLNWLMKFEILTFIFYKVLKSFVKYWTEMFTSRMLCLILNCSSVKRKRKRVSCLCRNLKGWESNTYRQNIIEIKKINICQNLPHEFQFFFWKSDLKSNSNLHMPILCLFSMHTETFSIHSESAMFCSILSCSQY